MRLLVLVIIFSTAFAAPSIVNDASHHPFQNPVSSFLADPFILRHNGLYFMYGTNHNFPVQQSSDLVRWKYIGDALNFSAVDAIDLWAPEVTYRNGKFYLYVSKYYQLCYQHCLVLCNEEEPRLAS
jgi:beta-xylosidase